MPAKRNGKTVEDVYRQIKLKIYYNMLAPGQKLIYQDLAQQLNTSITPVVQALKLLERSRIVRYEPNKGYFVGEITETEARELYQAREALEIYSVPLILNNLDKAGLDAIRKAFKGYSKAATSEERRVLMIRDAQFHLKIIEYAHNQTIYGLLEDIFERIYLRYKPEYLWQDRIRDALTEHRAMLEALGEGNLRSIKRLFRKHIQKGKEHIINNLRRPDDIFFNERMTENE
ncbi:MAG: GntR family transcriptional regulator [Thermodesulfobacteriota bacterium]